MESSSNGMTGKKKLFVCHLVGFVCHLVGFVCQLDGFVCLCCNKRATADSYTGWVAGLSRRKVYGWGGGSPNATCGPRNFEAVLRR